MPYGLTISLERQFWGRGVTAVAGVDEVGVGALAGSVVAAAVILAPNVTVDGLADSKRLTASLAVGVGNNWMRHARMARASGIAGHKAHYDM
jgi:ribonuclease HII